MPLESGTYLSDFDPTYPLGGDPTNKGDDHLRLIKTFIVNTFPGVGGNGFAQAILATEVELNYIQGLTSNAQIQFNNLGLRIDALETTLPAPVGTRMPFHQAAAPTGWTQDVTKNDYMLRVVSTAGGGDGGTDSPINFTHTHTTAEHTLTVDEIPPHTHTVENQFGASYGQPAGQINNTAGQSGSTGGGLPHEHGDTGSTGFTPKYLDMIICVKD